MKKYTFKIALLHCFLATVIILATVISCNPNVGSSNNNAEKKIDSTYIKDSLALERRILACDTPYKSVDILIIHDATNDDDNSVSFFSQMDAKGQILSGGKPIDTSISIFYPYAEPTYRVSKNALYYLAEYVDNNCVCRNPAHDDDPEIFGVYYFELMQGEQTKTCFVYLRDIDSVIEYFQGLKVWLNDSKYKNEFRDFFNFIDRQIRELNKEQSRR